MSLQHHATIPPRIPSSLQESPLGRAASTDGGGTISMGLMVDGIDQGSIAVQEIKQGAGDSQRTVSASFLTTWDQRLKSGNHTIQVYIITSGDFAHLAVNQDVPLLIFD